MAIIPVLKYPDPRLKRKAVAVKEVNDAIKTIVKDMFETHYSLENCAALAATQLDIPNAPSITVIDFSEKKNKPLCLINPEIIEFSGETHTEEGCMSIPAAYEKVKRAEKIRVRALNEKGESIELEADGFLAKCIQHEIDHLQGKVFLDALSRLKRDRQEILINKYYRFRKKKK